MAKKDEEQKTNQDKEGGAEEKTPVKDARGRIIGTKLTAAAAAVKRMVPKLDWKGQAVKDKDGNPVAVPRAVKEEEVMSFAEYEDRIVVVTKSGEKLEGAK